MKHLISSIATSFLIILGSAAFAQENRNQKELHVIPLSTDKPTQVSIDSQVRKLILIEGRLVEIDDHGIQNLAIPDDHLPLNNQQNKQPPLKPEQQ